MADEIITELWRIKDGLGEEAGWDMKAFCRRLNEEARRKGEVLVSRSCSVKMMVAEEPAEYGTGKREC